MNINQIFLVKINILFSKLLNYASLINLYSSAPFIYDFNFKNGKITDLGRETDLGQLTVPFFDKFKTFMILNVTKMKIKMAF